MSHGVSDAAGLNALIEKADVVAFGPGLGQSDWSRELFAAVAASEKAAVWDADGLNLLAMAPDVRENRVITPHPGEAATLLEMSTSAIQADRPLAVDALTSKYGGVAVLKGAGTLVSTKSGVPFLCTAGNPGMAAAGMGDALTGIIAALIGQGLTVPDAAKAGVQLHACAGDRAAVAGERGMLASDLIAALQHVANP
jgi:NAD(P)H-hydrate epimerase